MVYLNNQYPKFRYCDKLNLVTAKQNQKFPFHFLSAPPTPPAAENKKGKENFWVLHTRVRESVRGALVRITTQSERTRQFQATTRSARAKSGILLEMGSNFFKQTPHQGFSQPQVPQKALWCLENRRFDNRPLCRTAIWPQKGRKIAGVAHAHRQNPK